MQIHGSDETEAGVGVSLWRRTAQEVGGLPLQPLRTVPSLLGPVTWLEMVAV